MPKRKTNQNKKRKGKKGGKSSGGYNENNNNNNNNNTNIDFDALIEQQINQSNQSHSSISQMLQSKIAEIEQSQKRQQNAALFKKNVIIQQMNMMKQQYENDQADQDQFDQHRQELYKFIQRINDIFYDVLESETSIKSQSNNLIQQNDTLKKLCKKLQEDKKILNRNIDEIEEREKKWRNEIEGKFQNSLQDIKVKITDHESRYNAVVEENKKLRGQLQEFLDYDKKRSSDFELYKEHQTKLDEIHDKEKENFQQMVEKEKQQTLKLTNNLKQAIEINELLKQRCNQYEVKFVEMGKTVKESSKCIDEYKKMNIELMKQNKQLHTKLNDIMSKYKQLNSYNDQAEVKNLKSNKRIETLSELCRKLQSKNKDLKDDLKMAKTNLFNQGITLQFKSDITDSPKKKETTKATNNESTVVVANGTKTENNEDGDGNDMDHENDRDEDEEAVQTANNVEETAKDKIPETNNDENTVDSKHEDVEEEYNKPESESDHVTNNEEDKTVPITEQSDKLQPPDDENTDNNDDNNDNNEQSAATEQAATF